MSGKHAPDLAQGWRQFLELDVLMAGAAATASHAKVGGLIVSLHVATGAAGGALVRSRLASLPLGLFLHVAGDWIPHEDIPQRRFEIGSGIAGVLLLAAVRGPIDPAVTGALAASCPDLEHLFRLPRPGGRKLFPSHRLRGWHRSGGVPASVQLLVAGLLIGFLVRRREDEHGGGARPPGASHA
jgi:hypothetical protein